MNREINTDEEMKQINEMMEDLLIGGEPVLAVDLRTGDSSEIELFGSELRKRIDRAFADKEIILFKKRCKHPEECKVGEWHNAIIIAEGELFISWDASQAVAEMTMMRILGGLLGGSDGKQ